MTGKNHKGKSTGLFFCSNCGNEKDGINISRVASGVVKSCGCLKEKSKDSMGTVWANLKLLEVTNKSNQFKGLFECFLCGSLKSIKVAEVKAGRQTDCGCSKYHGYSNHKSMKIYSHMIARCNDPLVRNFPQYGGRGVTVCPRWMEPNGDGLRNFMLDVGDSRPDRKHSLHRMWKYNEENKLVEMMEYGPDTVKWATARQQAVERRSPKLKKRVVEFEKLLEEGLTLDQMASKMKLKKSKIEFFLSTMGLLDGYEYKEGDDT